MTYVKSTFRHPALPKNDLGYTVDYYEGSLSTLCAGGRAGLTGYSHDFSRGNLETRIRREVGDEARRYGLGS